MSWRDDTPQPVQDDLDLLADQALSAAQHLLENDGQCYPFAVNLSNDGTPEMAAADPGEGEPPSSQAVLELLYSGAAAQRDAIRAVAFAATVETADGDAVRVEIEHRDGGPSLAANDALDARSQGRAWDLAELAPRLTAADSDPIAQALGAAVMKLGRFVPRRGTSR